MSMPPKSSGVRQRWRNLPRPLRWLVVAVVAIPGTFLAFIAAANLLLWTGAIEGLVSGTRRMATVELEIGRAWMLWPGTVHVRDFQLDVDAYRYQLHIELPEGVAEISLFELLGRTFHTRSIVGSDASIVLLLKMPHDRVDERRLANFPTVGSFGPAIRTAEEPDLPTLDEAFSIELEGVDATLTRLWVSEFRFDTPNGHLTGNMAATPGHNFGVWDTTIELEHAVLGVADREAIVDGVEANATLDIVDFDPFGPMDQGIMSRFSADVQMLATIRDISFASAYLPDRARSVALGGGEGPLALGVSVKAGVLQPGTFVHYHSPAARVFAGKLVVGTQLELAMAVTEQPDGKVVSRADVQLDGVHGGFAGTKHSGDRVIASDIDAFVAFAAADLASDEWPLSDLLVSIPHLRLVDLHDLAGAIDGPKSLGGRVDLSWRSARLDNGRFGHGGTLQTHDLSWKAGGTSIRGTGSLRIAAQSNKSFSSTTIGTLRVAVDGLAVHTKNGQSEGTWIRVSSGTASVNHRTGRVDARLRGRLDDLRPIMAHANARDAFRERAPDLDLTQPLDFDIGVHVQRKAITIDIDRLSRPALHVMGKVRIIGKQGRFAIQLRDAHIGAFGQTGSKPTVVLSVPDSWLAGKVPWVEAVGKRS